MIAAIEQIDTAVPTLHVALHTGRKGLSVIVTTYCSQQLNASNGVIQVPDSWMSMQTVTSISDGRTKLRPCKACSARIKTFGG